jgi:diguanylate cyclase (GGDEF)-like protein
VKPVILIVDDNEDNRALLLDVLEDGGFELREAADGATALAMAEREPPDLVLLDVMMPGIDGIECCRRLRGRAETRHVPIILVTARDGDRDVADGLGAGANDYISKPFSAEVVRARVRAALRTKHSQDELHRLTQRLERQTVELAHLALHDALTGLPNRVLFQDRLDQAIRRAVRRPEYHYAVLFIDIDGFKSVNDTFGHEAGDVVLRTIGQRLQAELRAIDTVAAAGVETVASRFGGDEYVVLLDDVDGTEAAERVARRLATALAERIDTGSRDVTLTASIGVVMGRRGHADPADVLADADQAMYEAKRAGKGRCVVFEAHDAA